MVTQWGFAKNKLSAVAWEQDGAWYGPQAASPETETQIDAEVKELVAEAYARCKKLLFDNREMVDEMTEMMIEQETIDYLELRALTKKYYPDGIPGAKGTAFMPLDEIAKLDGADAAGKDAAADKLAADFVASKK